MNNKAVAAIVACFLFFQVILKFSRIPKVAEILKGSEKTKQQLNCKASEMSASMRFGCFTTVKFVLFLLLLIFLDISNCRHCHLPPTGFSGLSPRHELLLQLPLYPFIDNDTLTARNTSIKFKIIHGETHPFVIRCQHRTSQQGQYCTHARKYTWR